jgi:hypothetical protein
MTYPNVKVEVLVCDRLDVEAYRGYRGDNLTNLDELLAPQAQANLVKYLSPSICTAKLSFLHCPIHICNQHLRRPWWARSTYQPENQYPDLLL